MSLNAAAVARTVNALRVSGKLRDEDAATVQMVESLALAVDSDPGNASLWREFRAGLQTLMARMDEGTDDQDEVKLIVSALRGAAPVVDAEDSESGDPRTGGGAHRRAARGSADAVAEGGR